MTEVPTWVLWLVGFGTPVLTAAVAGVGVYFARKGTAETRLSAQELDTARKREETLQNVRWAAELTVSTSEAAREMGAEMLRQLLQSDLLQPQDRQLVFGMANAALTNLRLAYSQS